MDFIRLSQFKIFSLEIPQKTYVFLLSWLVWIEVTVISSTLRLKVNTLNLSIKTYCLFFRFINDYP